MVSKNLKTKTAAPPDKKQKLDDWPERTEFARRLRVEGLDCLACLDADTSESNLGYERSEMVNGLTGERFRRVYAIKKELGLLTAFEERALKKIEDLCAGEPANIQDDIWMKVHGDPHCLKPAYLLRSDCNLEHCLDGQTPAAALKNGAREPECHLAVLCGREVAKALEERASFLLPTPTESPTDEDDLGPDGELDFGPVAPPVYDGD